MAILTSSTINFLKALKKNNDRTWFQSHKEQFEWAYDEYDAFINSLIHEIAKFDKSVSDVIARDCLFRIYKDIRFAKDKTPYKTHFGAWIVKGGKSTPNRAGYYVHLEPGKSFLAGGIYQPPTEAINLVRSEIEYRIKDFKKIISNKTFVNYFKAISGEKLKTAPKGFPKDHPDIELLKFKSYIVTHAIGDKKIIAKDFLKYAAQICKTMYPFNEFLNQALS
jgi:uncharacterized protein (TIGR02453 family)